MNDSLQAPIATQDTPSVLVGGNGHHEGGSQWHELVTELDGLERRLATQPVIEQAKGILMCHFGIGPEMAFAVLRRWSSRTNVKVRDIGRMIVSTVAAESPADRHRVNRELIDVIHLLDKGQIPTSSE